MMRVSTGALLVFSLVGLVTQAQGVIPTGFPDLVILEVKYETYFPKDIEKGLFTIVIKNRGAVDSATSKTAVLLLHDIYEQVYVGGLTYRSIAASLYGTASVPPVPAGASVTVAVEGAPERALLGPGPSGCPRYGQAVRTAFRVQRFANRRGETRRDE